MKDRLIVFDVESIGLHGPGFAVGFVVIDFYGKEIEEGIFAVKPESVAYDDPEGLKWVLNNVKLHPSSYNCSSLQEVRQGFWRIWEKHSGKAIIAADVNWPVESNFLTACISDSLPSRYWKGPYPLLDIASFRLGAGEPAMQTEDRLERELPAHNPLMDARQSARQLVETLQRLTNNVHILEEV